MTKHKKGKNSLNSALNGALTSSLRSSLATSGSIAPFLNDLVLWLETTSIDSFDVDERVDGASVSTWYDTKPGLTSKFNAIQSTGNLQPTYDENVINGLPALFFDDSSDSMVIDTGLLIDDDFTIFIIFNSNGTSANRRALNGTSSNWLIGPYLGNIWYYASGLVTSSELILGKFYITVAVRSTTASFYVNGDPKAVGSSLISTPGNLIIGGGQDIAGYVAEIIVYERALSNGERKAVERYLSAKWGIALD